MSRRLQLAAVLLALGSARCLFAPAIEADGYATCSDDAACRPGWRCQVGYCAPPAWWHEQYAARYQVLVDNPGADALAVGSLAELLVGPQGDLSVEQTGFGPTLVQVAADGAQTRAVAMRDPRGEAYAFVFRLPSALAAGATLGALWLYVGGDSALAPVYSEPADVYAYHQPFTAPALPEGAFRSEGTLDLNGADALLRPGAWLVAQDDFAAWSVRVDAQLLGADCVDWGVGLSAGALPQSLTPPYALFTSTGSNEVAHEVQATSLTPAQTVGDAFFSDGSPHRFGLTLVGSRVRFSVDDVVTAEAELEASVSGPLHLHVYSRDCTLRLDAIAAAPAELVPPTVRLSERVLWYP